MLEIGLALLLLTAAPGYVLGATRDVGVTSIVSPTGVVPHGWCRVEVRIKNYATVPADSFRATFTMSNGYRTTQLHPAGLPAGDSVNVRFDSVFLWDAGVYYGRCSTLLAGDENRDNDRVLGMAVIADIGGYPWEFTATPDSGGWTKGTPAPPRPPAHSGGQLWGAVLADSYPNSAVCDLVSHTYLAWTSHPIVGFWNWYRTEAGRDGGNLSYSDDNGLSWHVLHPKTPYVPDYTGVVAALNDSGFSGTDTWHLTWFDVPVAAYRTFLLRWRFASDSVRRDLGWMIDDCLRVGFDTYWSSVSNWYPMTNMPGGPRGKGTNAGACLAPYCEPDDEIIFALKGNKTNEVYRYSVRDNLWTAEESIPPVGKSGAKKPVGKGGALAATRDRLYAAKGNGTYEWWQLGIAPRGLSWYQKADIPAGSRGLKEGTGAVAVDMADTCYIYFLVGSGTRDFLRYNTATDVWQPMALAPSGLSGKSFKKGSCLALSPDHRTIFVLKGSANEFYAYDIAGNTWTTRADLPSLNREGKKKKAGDGASLACLGNRVFAIKGNNSVEFWSYSVSENTWSQMDDMRWADPIGCGPMRRVKGGGALTTNGGALFELHGNKTLAFSRYITGPVGSLPDGSGESRSAEMTAGVGRAVTGFSASPSVFASHVAMEYCLQGAATVELCVYNASGRRIRMLHSGGQPAGVHQIRWDGLDGVGKPVSRGVYYYRLTTGNSIVAGKLTKIR